MNLDGALLSDATSLRSVFYQHPYTLYASLAADVDLFEGEGGVDELGQFYACLL